MKIENFNPLLYSSDLNEPKTIINNNNNNSTNEKKKNKRVKRKLLLTSLPSKPSI